MELSHIIFTRIERLPYASKIIMSFLSVMTIGIIDAATVRDVSISIFYIMPVSFAAWFMSKWWGIVTSLMSAVVWFAADAFTSPSYSHPIVPYWNALVMFGIFVSGSLVLSALRASQQRERMIAREIQSGLMPKEMLEMAGIEFAAAWLPASEVGGDYYDILQLDDTRVAVCIADAAGHGVTAALIISNFQATLRLLSAMYSSPADLCIHINDFIVKNLGPPNLITFFYGIIDTRTMTLLYTNAGHTRPVLARADRTVCELSAGGIPLGVKAQFPYEDEAIALAAGDIIVMYTDGLVELTSLKNEMFGIQKLKEIAGGRRNHHAGMVRDAIMNAVKEFGWSKIEDDLTLLVLSMTRR